MTIPLLLHDWHVQKKRLSHNLNLHSNAGSSRKLSATAAGHNMQVKHKHYGIDFVNDDADSKDDHGHGTHCAGIAAAEYTVPVFYLQIQDFKRS